MSLLSRNLNNYRSTGSLSLLGVILFGFVHAGSAAATVVPRYAYVAGANGISIYTVNTKTGQLRSDGYAFPGSGLGAATVDPSGKYLYALGSATLGDNLISAFTIDATSGALTAIAGSPYATGSGPQSITVDPSDDFLYVTNDNSNSISAYAIDSSTGGLSSVNGSPFASGQGPASLAIDPSGRFAYVGNENDSPGGDVSGYTIDATTGALIPMAGSPFLSGSGGFGVIVAPSGKFGYVGSGGGAQITAFSINSTTGIPTEVAGSPFIGPGAGSVSIVVSPSSKYVYAIGNDNISAFSVKAATGKLTSVAGSPFAAGDNAYYGTIAPGGNRLYVRNIASDDVWTYQIAGSGALTLMNEVRTPPGFGPVALLNGSAAVTYTARFAYVVNQGSNTVASSISAYTIDAKNGHMTAVSGSPFEDGGSGTFVFAASVAVDPSSRFAYVANGNNTLSAYTIDATTGALTTIGSPIAAGPQPNSVTVDPSGRFVYVANGGSGNPNTPSVSAYAINASTGALTAITGSPFATGGSKTASVAVTMDPTGQFVYVASVSLIAGSGNISALTINPSTGALTTVSGSPFGATNINGPGSVAVDASGRFAYVANLGMVNSEYEMSAFAINSATGALAFLNYSPNLGAGTNSVATDPSGQFAYGTQIAVSELVALGFNSTNDTFSLLDSDVCIVNNGSAAIAVDPSGKFAYVANSEANNVTACSINQTTGDLGNISGEEKVEAGTNPISVVTAGTFQ